MKSHRFQHRLHFDIYCLLVAAAGGAAPIFIAYFLVALGGGAARIFVVYLLVASGGGAASSMKFSPVEEAMLALLKDTDIHSLQDVPDIEQPTNGTFLSFVWVILMT